MTAKEYLNDIRKMDLEIKTLQDQIVKLRQNAEGLKAMELSDMPRGGKSKDLADYVAELADLQMKCVSYITNLVEKKDKAMDCIMQIDGSELRNVLLLRYIQCLSWDEIADRMQYSIRTIFSLHGSALSELSKVCSNLQ